MFGKERRRFEDTKSNLPESVIAANTKINGKITGPDTVRIAGQFEGNIESEGMIIIMPTGKVKAAISCESLIVDGTIHGNVERAGTVEVRESGRIQGDISCNKIALAKGAFVDGTVHMSQQDATPTEFVEKREHIF